MRKVIDILNKVRNTPKTNEKKLILQSNAENELLKNVLLYTYNNATYGFSEEILESTLEQYQTDYIHRHPTDIFGMLDMLSKSNINDSIREKVGFELNGIGEQCFVDLYKGMITKDLRLGISTTTINKVFKNLIPSFEVQQAYAYEKYPLKDKEWFSLSLKLNGIRGTVVGGKLMSRQGHLINGFDHIIEALRSYVPDEESFMDMVFDGELVYMGNDVEDDNERFRKTTSIVNSNDEVKNDIKFVVFDITTQAVLNGEDKGFEYKERMIDLYDLKAFMEGVGINLVEIAPIYYTGTDITMIDKYLLEVSREKLEGLMLNKNVEYKPKRHSGILKVKKFYTMDLEIVGFEEGKGRLVDTLGNIIVDFKGNEVRVGSGFTDEMRDEIWLNQDKYLGRVVEVKYKEISKNSVDNLESLQFPVFIGVRELGKAVSYD